MSFIENLLSGKYPQLENLWRKELGKVIDEAFTMLTTLGEFDEIDEQEPAVTETCSESYDRVVDMLKDERNRHEATRRALELVKKEKATLQYKLDSARHELST